MNIFGQTPVYCIFRHSFVLTITFKHYFRLSIVVCFNIFQGPGQGLVVAYIIYASKDIVSAVMILNFGQLMLDNLTFGQITQYCVNEYFWPDTSFLHFPPLFCSQNISIAHKHYFRLKRVACFAIFEGPGQGLVEVFIIYGSNLSFWATLYKVPGAKNQP